MPQLNDRLLKRVGTKTHRSRRAASQFIEDRNGRTREIYTSANVFRVMPGVHVANITRQGYTWTTGVRELNAAIVTVAIRPLAESFFPLRARSSGYCQNDWRWNRPRSPLRRRGDARASDTLAGQRSSI